MDRRPVIVALLSRVRRRGVFFFLFSLLPLGAFAQDRQERIEQLWRENAAVYQKIAAQKTEKTERGELDLQCLLTAELKLAINLAEIDGLESTAEAGYLSRLVLNGTVTSLALALSRFDKDEIRGLIVNVLVAETPLEHRSAIGRPIMQDFLGFYFPGTGFASASESYAKSRYAGADMAARLEEEWAKRAPQQQGWMPFFINKLICFNRLCQKLLPQDVTRGMGEQSMVAKGSVDAPSIETMIKLSARLQQIRLQRAPLITFPSRGEPIPWATYPISERPNYSLQVLAAASLMQLYQGDPARLQEAIDRFLGHCEEPKVLSEFVREAGNVKLPPPSDRSPPPHGVGLVEEKGRVKKLIWKLEHEKGDPPEEAAEMWRRFFERARESERMVRRAVP